MNEFRTVVIISLAIIFVSVFFAHYAFNSYIRASEICSYSGADQCKPENLSLLMFFCFAVIVVLVFIIETIIYLMFRWFELGAKILMRGSRESAGSLRRKKAGLVRAKRELQKKYLQRKISEAAFKSMKDKYDSELIRIETELGGMKKRRRVK